jgi:hypothetical protein
VPSKPPFPHCVCAANGALRPQLSEISYPFLDYVECSAPDKLDYANEINRLATLIDWRTAYYWIAWSFSIIAIPLFLVMFWMSLNWKKQGRA